MLISSLHCYSDCHNASITVGLSDRIDKRHNLDYTAVTVMHKTSNNALNVLCLTPSFNGFSKSVLPPGQNTALVNVLEVAY